MCKNAKEMDAEPKEIDIDVDWDESKDPAWQVDKEIEKLREGKSLHLHLKPGECAWFCIFVRNSKKESMARGTIYIERIGEDRVFSSTKTVI